MKFELGTWFSYAIVYGLPVAGAIFYMVWLKRRAWAKNREILNENIKLGMTEPASLHPVIDNTRCIGCGVCVPACPEGNVLGLIDGKVELINPTQCIGHGACRASCPMDAITLVFGTAKRGMDIPHVDENFQTNVPGIYIAGELGGMGLIRNAISQGRQALEAISRRSDLKQGGEFYDVVVVGAGPAGLTATLMAKQFGLRYVAVEQESIGGTIAHFPRGKVVMTQPFELPGVGRFNFREVSKEQLMETWMTIVEKSGIVINDRERMENIQSTEGGYIVRTSQGAYPTRTVLLAVGRRGTPRKLGVPGEEDSPKVIYSLTDASLYRGKKVLVVGGGNSAVEAAVQLADEPGTEVILSYRSESFTRVAKKNREKLQHGEADGKVKVWLKSSVKEIRPETIIVEYEGQTFEIENDLVIVSAGGILPTPFLKELGIVVETKYGTA